MLPFPNTRQQETAISYYTSLFQPTQHNALYEILWVKWYYDWTLPELGKVLPLSQHTGLPLRLSLYRCSCVIGFNCRFVTVQKNSMNRWNLSLGWKIWSKALLSFFWCIKEKFLPWHYKMLNLRDQDWSDNEVFIYDNVKIFLALFIEETYWFTVDILIYFTNKTSEVILPVKFWQEKIKTQDWVWGFGWKILNQKGYSLYNIVSYSKKPLLWVKIVEKAFYF